MNSRINIVLRVLAQGKGELRQMDQALKKLDRQQRLMAGTMSKNANLGKGMWSGFMRGSSDAFTRMERFGKNLQWTGRQVEFRFGLPLLAAGAIATKFALDNERAIAKVQKVYGDLSTTTAVVNKDMVQLRRVFEALSEIFGIQQKEVAEIAAGWAAAGLTGAALARATRNTLETMILGEMDAAAATKSLITIQQQYGLTTKETTRALDVLNVVENETAANLSELIDGFTRGGASARSAGVDIEHMAALLAVLVPAVGSGAQAGNALKTIFSRILAPTKQASEAMAQMGINTDDAGWRALTGAQRLEKLAQTFQEFTPAQRAIATSFIATRFQISRFDQIMRDVIDSGGIYQTMLRKTSDATANQAIRQRELNILLKSPGKAFDIIKVKLQNAMTKAILPLLPAILRIADGFANLAKSFSNLSPQTQQLVFGFLALLAVTGPLFAYLGTTMTLVGRLGAGFVYLGRMILGAAMFFLPFETNAQKARAQALKLQRELEASITRLTAMSKTMQATIAKNAFSATKSWETGAYRIKFVNEAAAGATSSAWQAAAGATSAAGASASGAWEAGAAGSTAAGQAASTKWVHSVWTMAGATTAAASTASSAWTGVATALAITANYVVTTWAVAMKALEWATGESVALVLSQFGVLRMGLVNYMAGLPLNWGSALQLMEGHSTKFVATQLRLFSVLGSGMTTVWSPIPVAWGGMLELMAGSWGTALALMAGETQAFVAQHVTVIEGMNVAWIASNSELVRQWVATNQGIQGVWVSTMGKLTLGTEPLRKTWIASTSSIVGTTTKALGVVTTEWFNATAAIGTNMQTLPRVWIATMTEIVGVSSIAASAVATEWFTATGSIVVAINALPVAWARAMGSMAIQTGVASTTAGAAMGAIPLGAGAAWTQTLAITAGGASSMAAITAGGGAAAGAAAAAGISLPVIAAIAAIVAAVAALTAVIVINWENIVSAAKKVFGPFVPYVKKIFAPIAGFFESVWNALPDSVRNAMVKVVGVIRAAAMAVYEWLSYLNPFAEHSPSLVNQVIAGVDLIGRKYASLAGIGVPLRRAIDLLREFKAVASMQGFDPQAREISEARATVSKDAPGMLPSFDALASGLPDLQNALNRIGAEFEKQEAIVSLLEVALNQANDAYDVASDRLQALESVASKASEALQRAQDTLSQLENTPIAGMKAMSDAIFATTMREKELRLEILKLEKAGQSVDSITDRMAALNGEIETLTGQRMDLQLDGAGSDVLGPLSDRIKELEGMRGGLGGSVSEIERLQEELRKVQQDAEILDLENSLKFDPLTRQIDQLINGMEEMPFDQLMVKIKAQKSEVERLTGVWEQADAAVQAQQLQVDQLEQARDRIQNVYDAEKKKLDELGTAYDNVEAKINEITSALTQMASAASQAAEAAAGAGGGGGIGAGGESFDVPGGTAALGAEGGNLKKLADNWLKEAQKEFGSLNPFKPIADFAKSTWESVLGFFEGFSGAVDQSWRGFTSLFTSVGEFSAIGDAFRWLGDRAKEAGAILGPELRKWGNLLDPLEKAFKKVWDRIGPWITAIGTGVGGTVRVINIELNRLANLWRAFWPGLETILRGAWEGVLVFISGILQTARGIIHTVLGLISGDFREIWEGITTTFGGIFWTIVGPIHRTVRMLQGLGQMIVAWVKLVGENIGNGFSDASKWLVQAGKDIWNGLWDGLTSGIEAIGKWIHDAVDDLIEFFTRPWEIASPSKVMIRLGKDIMRGLLNGLIAGAVAVVNYLASLPRRVFGFFGGAAAWLLQAGRNMMQGLWSGIQQGVGSLVSAIGGLQVVFQEWILRTLTSLDELPGKVMDLFAGAASWLLDAGVNIVQGLLEGIKRLVPAAITFVRGIPERIRGLFANAARWLLGPGIGIIQGLWAGLRSVWVSVSAWVSNLPNVILRVFAQANVWLLRSGREIINGLWTGIRDIWARAATWVSGIPDNVKSFFRGAINWLLQAGRDVLQGFWNGLKEKAGDVGNWLKEKAEDFVGFLKAPWKIFSPSKETTQMGSDIMEGLVIGVQGGGADVIQAFRSFNDSAKKEFIGPWETSSPSRLTFRLGKDIMKGFEDGVLDGAPLALQIMATTAQDIIATARRTVENGTRNGETNFGRELINGFTPPEKWGEVTGEKYRDGVIRVRDAIKTQINELIPDVEATLSSMGEDISPQGMVDGLNTQIASVREFQANVSAIVLAGNPLLAQQVSDLGPEAGSKLAKSLVEQGPGIQQAAEQALGTLATESEAARTKLINAMPAFGLVSKQTAELINTTYGGTLDLATVTNGALMLAKAVVAMDPGLVAEGAIKGGQLTDAFRNELKWGGVTGDQIRNAQAIFAADRSLPEGAGTLARDAQVAFTQAMVIAGVPPEQIKKIAEAFDKDSSAEGAAKRFSERSAKNYTDGLGTIDTEKVKGHGNKIANVLDDGFRRKLKINSPSLVMVGHGRDIAQGLRNGIDLFAPQAVSAVDRMIEGIRKSLVKAPGIFKNAWKGIKSAFSDPINWVISNVINAFISGINGISHGLGRGNLVSRMGRVPEAHSGGVIGDKALEKQRSLAPAAGEQLAMLQKGEGVIPRNAMAKMSNGEFEMIRKGKLAMIREQHTDAYEGAQIPPTLAPAMARAPQTGDSWWGSTTKAITDPMATAIDAGLKRIPEVKQMIHEAVSLMHATAGKWGGRGQIAVGGGQTLANKAQRWLDEGKVELEKKKKSMGGDLAAWRGKPGSDDALIKYLKSTGVPHTVTSKRRPGAITRSGNVSNHALMRAVDFGGFPDDSVGLGNIFKAFAPVEGLLDELIYAGPQVAYNIDKGRRVAKYAVADHHDHVHAALAAGGLVRRTQQGTLARLGEGRYDEAVLPLPQGIADFTAAITNRDSEPATEETTLNFYGNLSFPNITSGDDAEEFIKNIKALATD